MIVRLVGVAAVVVVLVAATGAVLAFRRPTPGEPVPVVIEQGASTAAIAQRLADLDVISSSLGFRLMARIRGLDGSIRAGSYELRRGMGVHAALDRLSEGSVDPSVAVTIPEGFTVQQVVAKLADASHLSREALAAGSAGVRGPFQPDGIDNVEGFLFPDTYRVADDDEPVAVLQQMVDVFSSRTATLSWVYPEARGLSRYDALIIASLIEREAKVDEDRRKVSAVIYNRLERGMRLQIDITALYGTDHKVPTRRDLERRSPYNTYIIDGLPPTPIANPGLASIEAALDPEPIDALYYVVVDPSGKHAFTADYDEFQRLLSRRPAEVRG